MLGRSVLGLKMGKFCQITYRVTALDLCSKLRFSQYLLNKWMDFDKNLRFGIQ